MHVRARTVKLLSCNAGCLGRDLYCSENTNFYMHKQVQSIFDIIKCETMHMGKNQMKRISAEN